MESQEPDSLPNPNESKPRGGGLPRGDRTHFDDSGASTDAMPKSDQFDLAAMDDAFQFVPDDSSLEPSKPEAVVEAMEVAVMEEDEREEYIARASRRRYLMAAAPSWLISFLVHVALIVILAAITLDPVKNTLRVLEATPTNTDQAEVEAFDLEGPVLESSASSSDPLAIETPEVAMEVAMPEIKAPEFQSVDQLLDSEANALSESILPTAMLQANAVTQITSALTSRTRQGKAEMLERYGGTAASEQAVARALRWIAAHQAPDGGWNFVHSPFCRGRCKDDGRHVEARAGATAMALLPFLGAGQTHLDGKYKREVYRGLEFLINRLEVKPSPTFPTGSWHEPGGTMYSHSCAAIAVCEAYAMTQDPDLLQASQLSLNYLVQAQHSMGGWRYNPGQAGDTSAVGWCLMALKSGRMGGLVVPPVVFQKTDRFLEFVSVNNGSRYGYARPEDYDRHKGCTPVGVLSRMYLGYNKEERVIRNGVQYLDKVGPDLKNLYFTYYATQVMRHHGGAEWDRWNNRLRDKLIEMQVQEGHATGSWYSEGGHLKAGGRLCSTSFATMILEVYYRHMPLYQEQTADEEFQL